MDENKLDLIFKAYDVRGVFNETITPKVGFKIGAAFASYVDSNEIIVGHDGRISNNEMFAAISSGIQSVNKKVLYVGMVPTDVVYTLSGIKNLPGLIITASHNPKEYTGLKFCDSGAVAIGQETGLKEIKNLAEKFSDDFNMSELPEMQTLNQLYFEHFKNIVDPSEISDKVKFAVDGGNGVLGAIIEDLSESFSLNFEGLYMEVDGNFPNHPADPSNQDNLLDLKNKVLSQNFDFGVAFDGDADRSVFVDDKGNVISGSMMTCLISDWLFEKKSEIKIVHNVNVQPSVIEYLKNKYPVYDILKSSIGVEKGKDLSSLSDKKDNNIINITGNYIPVHKWKGHFERSIEIFKLMLLMLLCSCCVQFHIIQCDSIAENGITTHLLSCFRF